MTRAARTALAIDVLVVSGRWKAAEKPKSIVRRAVARPPPGHQQSARSLLSF